jgi:hypothetical protein
MGLLLKKTLYIRYNDADEAGFDNKSGLFFNVFPLKF